MRLKVTHFPNTRSTVFSFAVWDSELHRLPNMARYMAVADGEGCVSDRLHALIMIANEVEKADAKRKEGQRGREVHQLPDDAADDTKEPVSV